MMNLKGLFLTALISFSATNIILANDLEQQEEIQQTNDLLQAQKLWNIYSGVIIPGLSIGYLTGNFSRSLLSFSLKSCIKGYTNSTSTIDSLAEITATLMFATAILTIENLVRTKLVNELNQIMENHFIKNKKNDISKVACIASWIAFL